MYLAQTSYKQYKKAYKLKLKITETARKKA